jgi:hypothetical protein
MERAGRLISTSKTGRKLLSSEEMTLAAWGSAVGKRLSGRTRAIRLHQSTLIVEVEDELWQRNLALLEPQILKNLTGTLGEGKAPRKLEFRVGIPRRPAAIATPPPASSLDEADRIADPVLSYLYRQSRRKAGA